MILCFPLSRALCVVALAAARSHSPIAERPHPLDSLKARLYVDSTLTPTQRTNAPIDSIYRLAVNPAEHSSDNAILLLDQSVTRIDDNGHRHHTLRQVVQILTQEAAQAWGEYSIAYVSSRQTLTIDRVRVVTLNGKMISDKPVVEQESNASVDDDAPMYTDGKVHRMSLSGVAPGTIVDLKYTIVDTAPAMPNDYFAVTPITRNIPVRRSRIALDVPAALHLSVEEHNMPSPGQTTEFGGRRITVWAANDVEVPTEELFASDSNDTRYAYLIVSSAVTWNDVAAWYAKLSAGRYVLDSATRTKIAEVVRPAKTRDDSLRAIHRWIAQDLRYVSLSLGVGGYQPRLPASVFETQYGDCKDKATLFIAAARAMGVDAYPVLLSATGGVRRDHPSAAQFDHAIAAVKQPGQQGYAFLDLTAELTPYGELPLPYQGSSALVVLDDGVGELVTLPSVTPANNVFETHVVGTLSPTGMFTGYVTEDARGAQQYILRQMAAATSTAEERQRAVREMGASVFGAGIGDSLVMTGGRDLVAAAHVAFALHGVPALSLAGTTQLLTLPFHGTPLKSMIETLRDDPHRKSWIDVEQIGGYGRATQELHVTLPLGWKAILPKPITADGLFGSYHTEYTQQGRDLRVVRTIVAHTGVQPPTAIPALITWLEQVDRDDVKFIALKKR